MVMEGRINKCRRLQRLALFACVAVAFLFLPSGPLRAQRVDTPLVISVGDILQNYGLDTVWVNDTAALMRYLDEQPQDYVALTNLCVSIRTKAQRAMRSIESDYEFRDSLIWLDENTVISDYPVYEFRLRRLAEVTGRMSIRYSRLEQHRIEAEKEAARQRAIEEARRKQEERNRTAADLRANIDLHHRAIITACDGAGVTDKSKLKHLKDLYYSYLMVYNKYDLSQGNATDESIVRLDELNAFQNDLLDNVLGANSLPFQIENFKNVLKVRCEKENTDVYRSYSKVFKNTNVPVTFADVREYEDYINRMQVIINVQQRYLLTLDLRATIQSGTEAISQLYGKKYRDMVNSYKEVLHTVNLVPSFTTNAESQVFIGSLEEFIAAQQIYIDNYSLLEDISLRSDSITRSGMGRFNDVVVAYREIQESLRPIPSFRDTEGALIYDQQLAAVKEVQQCYLDVIAMRTVIKRHDDTLSANRKVDRILSNGYRLLSKQAELRPSFSTADRGRAFLARLQKHIEMQELCLEVLAKARVIKDNDRYITDRELPYRNTQKAYGRMLKAYQGVQDIGNNDDLQRYNRQCDYILAMQEAFKKSMRGDMAMSNDNILKNETSIDKIKLVIGM